MHTTFRKNRKRMILVFSLVSSSDRFLLAFATVHARVFLLGIPSVVRQAQRQRDRPEADNSRNSRSTADAANSKPTRAIDLAIINWKVFCKKIPRSELSPKVAHYLGGCYMQSDRPELSSGEVVRMCIENKKYELRARESVQSRSWCFLTAAAEFSNETTKRLLKESLDTFGTLFKDDPKSSYRDRRLLLRGEGRLLDGQRGNRRSISNSKLPATDGIEKNHRSGATRVYALGSPKNDVDELPAAAKFV